MSKYDADDKRWVVERKVKATKANEDYGDYVEKNGLATIIIGPFHGRDQAVDYAMSHTSLMGYTYTDKVTGKEMVNSMGFSGIIRHGSVPRNPAKQKLLLHYASGEGNDLAWRKLRGMGKQHLYIK